jgi:hypothetical protein
MTYWLLALALVVFGLLSALSIGAPFLGLGLAMLILGPFRARQRVFWPLFNGVLVFVVVVVLAIPLGCEATSTNGGDSYTVCRSILGPTWSGHGLYNPPPEAFNLGLGAGAAAAAAAAAMTFAWLRSRGQVARPRSSDIRQRSLR